MKLRATEEPEANVDMTPMIDCVFLLLIFFMVSATMSKVDQTPEVKLPVAPKAAIPEDLRGRGVVNIVPLGTPAGGGATSEDQPFIVYGQLMDEARPGHCHQRKEGNRTGTARLHAGGPERRIQDRQTGHPCLRQCRHL